MSGVKVKKSFKLPSLKDEMATIIVLALAAVSFIVALSSIYSEDFLHGAGSIFSAYGNEIVEYETATVNKVLSEDLSPDVAMPEVPYGTQELSVTITSGRYKGEEAVVRNYPGALTGIPVAENDSVTLTVRTREDGTRTLSVYELNRIPVMAAFALLFLIVVVAVGGVTGFKSLVGLVFTGVCLIFVLIPLILKGAPAIPTTFAVCAYVALVCFVILGGVHRKSMCAFLGTLSGTFLALVCGLGVQWLSRLDGLRLDDAEPLYQLVLYEEIPIDIRGLLVASVIICSLGAVMDVAMSISSALEEIHAANPELTQKELFSSAMNVGRDAAGTMTNTLILALVGSEFPLMIYFYTRGLTFTHLASTAFVVRETISGLSSSIGMILAIPLTALISSTLITRAADK